MEARRGDGGAAAEARAAAPWRPRAAGINDAFDFASSEYVSEYTSKYVSEYTSEYISEYISECTS